MINFLNNVYALFLDFTYTTVTICTIIVLFKRLTAKEKPETRFGHDLWQMIKKVFAGVFWPVKRLFTCLFSAGTVHAKTKDK